MIPGLVDTHLAILDPKPHLYTFFTFKSPSGGFVAGIAKLGTVCYGHLTELYGNNVASYYRQESTRTSINMYANGKDDLDVAGVKLLPNCYLINWYIIIVKLEYIYSINFRLLLMSLAII